MNTPWLEEYLQFLRFPSISTAPESAPDTLACAQWLQQKLTQIGLQTELHPTPLHPIVFARNEHKPGLKTVLLYGHYDVQPPEPLELWDSPPFEPLVQDGYVYARGATDNKGQIHAHIRGIEETLREKGQLPVNLILLIEGEEEIGSPNLAPFLTQHKESLACDIVVISDTGMLAPNTPTLTYGLRGLCALELTLTGSSIDLHSGIYGGAIANPITALARLIASLHNNEGTILVPGFYDDVEPLQQWERDLWATLPYNEQTMLDYTHAPSGFGEVGYTAIERTWARPTIELNGIWGGYQGAGSKTVLPAQAHAKITSRLVPNQDPVRIQELITKHLQTNCPPGVTLQIEPGHYGSPYRVDPHSGYGAAAQAALQQALPGKPLALTREGGSVPIVADFKRILGADTLLLGLALPDARIHSPNERFPLENFATGIRLNRALLEKIAKV